MKKEYKTPSVYIHRLKAPRILAGSVLKVSEETYESTVDEGTGISTLNLNSKSSGFGSDLWDDMNEE